VEHILEWQVVTKFFEWVRDHKKPGNIFDSPDPTVTTKVDFCEYWIATWGSKEKNPPKFSIAGGIAKRNALEHLKYAYPGNNNHEKEFVWLEESINKPAKAEV
jgi:hypothetical protein